MGFYTSTPCTITIRKANNTISADPIVDLVDLVDIVDIVYPFGLVIGPAVSSLSTRGTVGELTLSVLLLLRCVTLIRETI